jgi:hypothetical protein
MHPAGPIAALTTAAGVGAPVQMVWPAAVAVQDVVPVSFAVMLPVTGARSGPKALDQTELVAGLTATLAPMACFPNGLVIVLGQIDEVAGLTA